VVDEYRLRLDALRASVLSGPGVTPPALRAAVSSRAAEWGQSGEPATTLTDDVSGYVDKVALHAYKVVDDDIERLRASGYSEDAIFEVTVSAALGAALERVERGLAVLSGDDA